MGKLMALLLLAGLGALAYSQKAEAKRYLKMKSM
jgi:hypothetical protein